MPTNVSVDYALAQEEYFKAKTSAERLAALKKMISTAPKHKSAEKLNAQLKRRLADLKKEIVKEKKAGKGKSFAIKKEGAATIVFLGTENSGKTKLFSQLANAEYKSENLYGVQMKMIRFETVWLQGIDLPAIHEGFAASPMAGLIFGLVRSADLIVLVAKNESEIKLIESELKKARILLGEDKKLDIEVTKMPFIVLNFSEIKNENYLIDFKKEIWGKIKKIRVQTKTRGVVAEKPLVLKIGATVRDLAETVHKDFVRKFRHAKIWGPSARFAGQQVGLEHKLQDNDIVELFIN